MREQWREIEDLYHRALECDESQRSAFLRNACGGDEALLREVESLLEHQRDAELLMEMPVIDITLVKEDSVHSLEGQQVGSYKILSLIGIGGMGEVYRARDTKLSRDVAIKVLPKAFSDDPKRLQRFAREAKVLASLNHPNIAAIYGIEEVGATQCLVLELADGKTLAERIKRGPLRMEEAVGIAKQIAEALEAAHGKGITHRDLKPENIKITSDGTVKVLDFGLAKFSQNDRGHGIADALTDVTISTPGMVLGTLPYMSPEQARGEEVGSSADVWAFGCVLYEMITGHRLFEGNTPSEILADILKSEPDWTRLPVGTPEEIRRLLRRCLQNEQRLRLHDMADARIEIDEARSRPHGDDGAEHGVSPRRPWMWVSFSALAALMVAMAILRIPSKETPLWFSLIPSEGKLSAPPVLAISPDGQQIVFAAENPSGTDSLWVRSLDSPNARELPGTRGGFMPFWSPDSRSIGFFGDGKLQRVNIDGGVPQVLAQAANPRGGTWGSQGTILFAPAVGPSLFSISASGGTVTPLKVPGAVPGADSSPWPVFLPDGKHFLFLRGANDRGVLHVGALDSLETKRIGEASSRAEYANGYLFYGKDADLFAQPFDLTRLELSGEARRVASGLGWSFGDVRSRAFSLSGNGTLAFSSQFQFSTTQPTWFDRLGRRLESVGDPGEYAGFTVAPDGKKLALEKLNRRKGGADLWLLELPAGILSRLTSEDLVNNPVWAPDNERIAYWNGASSLRGYKLFTLNRSKPESLPLRPVPYALQGWSPDGRFLLASGSVEGSQSDLLILRLEAGGEWLPFSQTPFNEFFGRISPDGHWIAYSDDSTGRSEVYAESFPQPTRKKPISRNGGAFPEWRRDGKELYYLTPTSPHRSKLMAVRVEATASRFVASPPEPLFETPAMGENPRRSQYAPFGTGDRFLLNALVEEPNPRSITVIVNWPAFISQQRAR